MGDSRGPGRGWVAVAPDDVASRVADRLDDRRRLVAELARDHVGALSAAAELDAEELLTDQVAYETARLADDDLAVPTLHDAIAGALLELAGPDAAELAASLQLTARDTAAVRAVVEPGELSGAAAAYLTAGLRGRRAEAVGVVRDRLTNGDSAWEVVSGVLMPAQVEVGRLWETGQVTIAQEHHLTAVTASCLALLTSRRDLPLDGAPRLLATTVAAEGHDLGLRVLVELMTERGWDCEYLGAGMPSDDLVTHVARTRPDVLALSATIAAHVTAARDLVTLLRRHPGAKDVKVLVGGRAISRRPALAGIIGADGWADDAASAIEVCQGWVEPARLPARVGDPDDTVQDRTLAERYRFEQRHMSHAVELLAEHSGLSVVELRERLSRLPEV